MCSIRLPALLAAASAVLVSGCAVGPDYMAPAAPKPGAFMNQPAVSARAVAVVSSDAWWKGFNDPVLDKLVERALSQNLDLAQAAARVVQARAGLGAATAALLPSASIQGQAARVYASTQSPTGRLLAATPGFDRDGSFYEGDLVAGWELDVFGGSRRDREAALARYDAAQAGVAAARLAVASQTADTYMLVRGLQERLAVARRQVETQSRLMNTVHLQYERGAAAELQFRQVQSALAQTRASIPVLEEGLEAALNAMDVAQGVAPGTYRAELVAATPVPLAPGLADAGGTPELLRRRPDLVVAEQRLRASNAEIGSALSQYFPKFSLSGLVGAATTDRSTLLDGPAGQAQGMIGIRWRLFDFGRVGAEVGAAKGRKAEALAAYQQAVLRASEDVENAFVSLVKREGQARELADGEAALAKARTSTQLAYDAGAVSLVEVLDADARLLAVRDAKAQARAEAARAAIRSFQALGGGWTSPYRPT